MKVLIVTVAYNPPLTLKNNLAVDFYPHLIIDNSEIETVWLKEYCELHSHLYQWMGENVGIAKALNVGASYAIEHGYDYIVTMDQDSTLTDGIISLMYASISQSDNLDNIAIFSPRHININDKYYKKNEVTKNDVLIMTSGNFLNLYIWKTLGGFDENLFIDLVDFDYNARVILHNYQIIILNFVEMIQYVGDNLTTKWIGKYGFDVWNHGKVRKYYQARNYNYVYRKYLGKIEKVKLIRKIILKMPLTILLFEKDKLRKLYYFIRGYIDFRLGIMGKKKW